MNPTCASSISDSPVGSRPEGARAAPSASDNAASQSSHGQILKSSALIGGASVINLALGALRMKAMALLLGPAGVGLLGVYTSICDLVRSVAGLGINTSGVRQIAEAAGSGDAQRIARTVWTLRRVALVSGLLGALLLVVFREPIARVTFGGAQSAHWLVLLALAVLFAEVSAAQAALVQGMRRIGDLARINVLGAFYGTVLGVGVVWFFWQQGVPERGVVPSIVCVTGMGILTSWWYARKVRVERVRLRLAEVAGEARALLRLGLVFMSTTLMAMGMAYLIRLILVRQMGVDAAGQYQAAWSLGGVYIGFIVQAMGADFYPRLTAVAKHPGECNRLVNEQAEVGLLLAGAGVAATLTFAPWVIRLFFSQEFEPAVEVLRWICLGMLLRVVSWPLGFILVARGEGAWFFWTELVANAIQLALVWFGVAWFGLRGAGMAFFGLYVVYLVGIYLVARRLTGFGWSAANRRLALSYGPAVALVFVVAQWLPQWLAMVVGGLVTAVIAVHSARTLYALIPAERWPRPVQRMFGALGLAGVPARASRSADGAGRHEG
ncbi:MAG: O-antigen translocase [Verrucomicrobiae bacterium]|nr:O-antigen translocase [Verrucomicrobiae bacterium]